MKLYLKHFCRKSNIMFCIDRLKYCIASQNLLLGINTGINYYFENTLQERNLVFYKIPTYFYFYNNCVLNLKIINYSIEYMK